MSSSTAFPQGEAFRFFFSPNGHMVLCINSSRIVVLDVTSEPIIRHELKTWRRPLNAAILDDGSLLAVVSSGHQLNVYRLSDEEAKHIQVLSLNDVPRAVTLSPTGSVLAVAYDNSIEVCAVGEGTLSNERRAVQCVGVDSISFSCDGTMVLGSSLDCERNDTVAITVPEAETGLPQREAETNLWTTQVVFPRTIQYSHASMLPLHAEGDGSWVLGYDSRVTAFKATKINNPNSGSIYLMSPVSSGFSEEPLPMVPTADNKGELVALGFQEYGVWLYGIPDRLDITPYNLMGTDVNGTSHGGLPPAFQNSSIRIQQDVSQPKVLIDGHKVIDMPGITAACWVQNHSVAGHRLVAVAPGGINLPTIGEEDVPVDSGRVLILDFERSPKNGETHEIEIEIGEAIPKVLKEPDSNIDTEIELERRRTRIHRNHTAAPRIRPPVRMSHPRASSDEKRPPSPVQDRTVNTSNDGDPEDIVPVPDVYDMTQPRSRDTLQRAATAAATHGRHRLRQSYELNQARRGLQIPHESDADNWVPPPPPYTSEPDAELPEYLRRTLLPTRTEPAPRVGDVQPQIQRARTTRLEGIAQETLSRPLSSLQRLNTITGSRIADRARRNRRDSESRSQVRRERSVLRRIGVSSGQQSDQPPVPSRPEPRVTDPPPPVPPLPDQVPAHPRSPSPPAVQTGTNHDAEDPPSPIRTPEDPEWQFFAQTIQNATSGLNILPFTMSTPELHVAEPPEEDPDTAEAQKPGATQRAQYQDPLRPTRGMGSLHRRVSTDPTHSQSSRHNSWRRRIEEWNDHAIYERNKKSRNKCIVM